MSSLAHYFGDDVVVTDVGVNAEIKSPGVLARKVRYGTGNIARERAMSEEETLRAMAIGMELAAQAKRDGVGAVGIGEMGIGNTTTSSRRAGRADRRAGRGAHGARRRPDGQRL